MANINAYHRQPQCVYAALTEIVSIVLAADLERAYAEIHALLSGSPKIMNAAVKESTVNLRGRDTQTVCSDICDYLHRFDDVQSSHSKDQWLGHLEKERMYPDQICHWCCIDVWGLKFII